ncbi:TonB-dependent receptor domain-containing protein [Emcibacter sp.]|uniref:TonB-dependent receptor domain-containing protein n=1 Tax=Emcibacter sp. TaxID=1979954 RepID=UPI002AA9051B|nr:TonB-dependent receptor [Emcibacter sp.]
MKIYSKKLKGALLASTMILVPAGVYAQQAEQANPDQDIEEVTVMGQYIPDEKRSTSEISNILDAADFSRLGDSDIAGSLKRLTGLSVAEDGVVIVRGLGDRYSNALLDGANLPSPDPLRRVVPLDIFPVNVLDGVLVQKTFSPEFPGHFGGGLIEMRTKAVPDEDFFEIGISTAYNTVSTFEDGLSYDHSDTDWLGFDDGLRDMPDAIKADPFLANMSDAELEAAGEAIANVWSADFQENMPDFGLEGTMGKRIDFDDSSLGILLSVSYDNEYRNKTGVFNEYINTSEGAAPNDRIEPEVCAEFGAASEDCGLESTTFEVDLNGILNIGYEFNGNNNIQLTSLLLRTSSRSTTTLGGEFAADTGKIYSTTQLEWVERQVWSNQLSGEHFFDLNDAGETQFNWRAVYATASRDVPMRKQSTYQFFENLDTFLLSPRESIQLGNGIFWGELDDTINEYGFDLKQPVEFGDIMVDLSAGGMYYKKERESSYYRYRFGFPSTGASIELRELVPEIVFGSFNINPDGFVLKSNLLASDFFEGSEEILAGYIKADAQISEDIRLAIGGRFEDTDQTITTIVDLDTLEQVTVEPASQRFLPAATLTWTFAENMQLRFAASQTLSRPDLRELAPVTYYDEFNRSYTGNPELETAKVTNLDARFEWYFGEDESLTIGAFYKDFKDPIEETVTIIGDGTKNLSWENAESGELYGVEVEANINIPLDETFEGEFWQNRMFYVKANGTYINSEVTIAEENLGRATNAIRPMQGQSEWLGNLQIGWDGEDDRFTVLLNYTGERIASVGTSSLPDLVEDATLFLDLVYKRDIQVAGGEMELSFKVSNILDEDFEIIQAGLVAEQYNIGTTFSIGVSQKF